MNQNLQNKQTPSIEVISIGNEILNGTIVNSNAAFISSRLFQEGIEVKRHTVLSDDPVLLKEGLKEALSRSSIVLTTGGLGPTCDDLTRQVAAELFHSDFQLNEELLADLKKRYGANFPTLIDQATIPIKAKPLKNLLGTAPGFLFEENQSLILMPGVPHEMKAMLEEEVIPFIKQKMRGKKIFRKSLYFFHLFEAQVDPTLRQLQEKYPHISYGIYPSLGTLRVHVSVSAQTDEEANQVLEPVVVVLKKQFHNNLFESPTGKLDDAIHHLLIEKKKTLSIAESCTGGALSARFTRHPGASQYFLGGMVAYANAFKEELLHVSKADLEKEGAVSDAVVKQMAEQIKQMTRSDIAISVSGIAGPTGGSEQKPVGTVFYAIATDTETQVWKLQALGTREMVIERSINEILGNLYKLVK